MMEVDNNNNNGFV